MKDVLKRTKNKIHFLLASFEIAYRPIPYVPDEDLLQIENSVDESNRYKKSNRKFMKKLNRKIRKNETNFSIDFFSRLFWTVLIFRPIFIPTGWKVRFNSFQNSIFSLFMSQVSGSSKIFEILLKFIENYWLEQWSMNDEISRKLFILVYCNNSKH